MLLMLLPEQLDRFWPYVRFVLEKSFSPEVLSGNLINNVLESLLTCRMQAWIYTEDGDSIGAIVVTSTMEDSALGGKILRLYLLYAFEPLKPAAWEEGWEAIEKFARSVGCKQIEAFSSNPMVIKKSEQLGWKSEYHLFKELKDA